MDLGKYSHCCLRQLLIGFYNRDFIDLGKYSHCCIRQLLIGFFTTEADCVYCAVRIE